MPTHLIVTSPFENREIGGAITDPAEVAEVRAGEHAQAVVAVEVPAADHDFVSGTQPAAEEE